MSRAILLAAALCACGSAVAAEPAKDCAAIADPAARLACYDAQHGSATPAPAPAAAAAPPAAVPDEFGLARKPKPDEAVKSIKAHLVGSLTALERGMQLKLDNGQVWKVISDETRYYDNIPENPDVVIERGLFGTFWMEIPAVRAHVKVKRVS